jgi:hypothetical protein
LFCGVVHLCVPYLTVLMYYRQKLRRLEVALIEYRESLEERGIKNSEEIERKVSIRRKQLLSEYGLLDSNDDSSGNSKCSFCTRAIYKIIEFMNFCPLVMTVSHVVLGFRFAHCFLCLLFLSIVSKNWDESYYN